MVSVIVAVTLFTLTIIFLFRSPMFHDFIKSCLVKNPKKRPSPAKLLQVRLQLLLHHSFLEPSICLWIS